MNAVRTDYSRNIDWSTAKSSDPAAAMRKQVLRFVVGIRGERESGVTRKQILAWFYGTPDAFVEEAVLDAVTRDEVNVCRTALVRRLNERYVYEITNKGREALKARAEPLATQANRVPVRFVMVMSDGTLEPIEVDAPVGGEVAGLDMDNQSDRIELCDAVRAALRRFKP